VLRGSFNYSGSPKLTPGNEAVDGVRYAGVYAAYTEKQWKTPSRLHRRLKQLVPAPAVSVYPNAKLAAMRAVQLGKLTAIAQSLVHERTGADDLSTKRVGLCGPVNLGIKCLHSRIRGPFTYGFVSRDGAATPTLTRCRVAVWRRSW